MNKAVFLDRDGTINVEKNYLYRPEDFEFLSGAEEALKMFSSHGYKLIVITNQSGIARGFYTEDDFWRLTDFMREKLRKSGVDIDGVYFCPHLKDAAIPKYKKECNCRKPATGLFYRAAEEHSLNLDECYSVGDKLRDLSICRTTGCKGYLIGENEKPEIIQSVKSGSYKNICYARDLLGCALQICK